VKSNTTRNEDSMLRLGTIATLAQKASSVDVDPVVSWSLILGRERFEVVQNEASNLP
jgi:hypothetical protein